MRDPEPLPPHLAQRPFTVKQARIAQLPRARTRASDLWTPSRDIRLPTSTSYDLLESCRVHIAATPFSFVSHLTAAKIHGMFLPSRFEPSSPLDLARTPGLQRPRRKYVHGHELMPGPFDVVVVHGVPVTSVQRTLLDIAPLLTVDELVVIGDQIVCAHQQAFGRRKIALVELNVLRAYVAQHSGTRGMRKLRAALELVKVGADSPPETKLRLIITRSPLPDFEPNVHIEDAKGREMVGPDLACKKYKTCAEYGGGHHFSAEQQSKDHDRDFITNALGWYQALINKQDMKAGELVVVTKIARMLVRGGWADSQNLARRSLLGELNTRKDFE